MVVAVVVVVVTIHFGGSLWIKRANGVNEKVQTNCIITDFELKLGCKRIFFSTLVNRQLSNLSLFRFPCDHSILHPGAIKVIMTLLPHIYSPSNAQVCHFLNIYVLMYFKCTEFKKPIHAA